jgi:DNA-directed RNA polymerase subunit RPC12/RpoP
VERESERRSDMSIRIWMCKNCGCEFPDEATPVPRVVPCPKCGDAVLLAKTKSVESDSRSFWAGFFFGWWGVLWAGFSKGRRGIDHAVAGSFIQWLSGIVIMIVLALVALLMLWLKIN